MPHGDCKLFFALRPTREAAEAADRLRTNVRWRLGAGGRVPHRERLHLSLNGLGRHEAVPDEIVDKAVRAVAPLRIAPFVVALNRLGSWGRGAGVRPVVLWGDEGVIGAELLYAALHEVLAAAGLSNGRRRQITPHLTLWRDARTAPEVFVEPVAWRVQEFALLAAIRGHVAHEVLGCWPLAG